MKRKTFIAKAGNGLIWSADLAHGGMPISNAVRCKNLVNHYVPLDFEQSPRTIRLHYDIFLNWTSGSTD